MTAEETALLRINLLRQLKRVDPSGLTLKPLGIGAKMEGFFQHVPEAEMHTAIAAHLDHLCDDEWRFVEKWPRSLSTVPKWKIRARGRDFLEQEGF